MAFTFLIVAFSTAITALHHSLYEFISVDKGMETLLEITLGDSSKIAHSMCRTVCIELRARGMYDTEKYKIMMEESIWVELLGWEGRNFELLHASQPFDRIAVIIFVILVFVVLLNLLVAQLNMAYKLAHGDMQGYARLTRASIIVTTVEQVSRKRWKKLLQWLGNFIWSWLLVASPVSCSHMLRVGSLQKNIFHNLFGGVRVDDRVFLRGFCHSSFGQGGKQTTFH